MERTALEAIARLTLSAANYQEVAEEVWQQVPHHFQTHGDPTEHGIPDIRS